jgi:hypothetical protein
MSNASLDVLSFLGQSSFDDNAISIDVRRISHPLMGWIMRGGARYYFLRLVEIFILDWRSDV